VRCRARTASWAERTVGGYVPLPHPDAALPSRAAPPARVGVGAAARAVRRRRQAKLCPSPAKSPNPRGHRLRSCLSLDAYAKRP
jgi:hypothetical protein